MSKNKTTILAIETSCDETAAAVLSLEGKSYSFSPSKHSPSANPPLFQKLPRGRNEFDSLGSAKNIKTLSSVVKSQIKIHKFFGGVFPEAAARAHVKNIRPVIEKALSDAKIKLENVDYFAVTVGPGLNPSLLVGVEFVKGLSFATGKPIIPVNHLAGHLYSPFGRKFQISNFKFQNIFPSVNLIVSGGHTILVLMKNLKQYKVLGQTVDDAAGEAFDKIARLLGLSYPGGPELSKLARDGNPKAINFPRPMLNKKNYNFSFSGLKTSVLYFMRDNKKTSKKDIAASVQQAIVDVLTNKTLRAAKEFKVKSIAISGGVSANKVLRNLLRNTCKKKALGFFMPPTKLSTDNAEMIGLAAAIKLLQGFKPVPYRKVDARPNLSL